MTATLVSRKQALESLWDQGVSGHALLERFTLLVDAFLEERFQEGMAASGNSGRVALVALGGYGRCELYPYSDIDLLLLHDRKGGKQIQEVAEAILYPLWDKGFDVGHSVRTVQDALAFAREDFIFQVSLLDGRFLCGAKELWGRLRSAYEARLLQGRRRDFVAEMDRLRAQRRERYGSHSYLLEPHIKEGRGGMRDIQAMIWVAKAVFGLDTVRALREEAILDGREVDRFFASWNYLARVRNRLHHLSRRKNDQLVFQYQEELAEMFGYRDEGGLLGVEHFMRQVYGHLQTVAVTTDLFFDHVHEILGLERDADSRSRNRKLEKAVLLRRGRLCFLSEEEVRRRPYVLMRIFLQAARTGQPLHHRSRQMVSRCLGLVTDDFRASRRVARIFLELITETPHPAEALEQMLETGLLQAISPSSCRTRR